jgi:hypothetical protein
MRSEIDPIVAQRRLEQLAALYVPETIEEGWRRLTADQRLAVEQAERREGFEAGAARRLEELRALCELTKVLHAARKL